MKLATRVWVIIAAAMLGMVIISAVGLVSLRHTMMQERESQITRLLVEAENMLKHYQQLETSGKLTHEEAQTRAADALANLRDGDVYFFARAPGNILVVHPKTERVGKVDKGTKGADGRYATEIYAEALSKGHIGIVEIQTSKPGGKVDLPKLNGVLSFEPWQWVIGTGFFIDDINAAFWERAVLFLGIGIAVLVVVAGLGLQMARNILRQLGGEPAYAASIANDIAAGDLSQTIKLSGPPDSLLGAMQRMQTSLRDMAGRFNSAAMQLADSAASLKEQMTQISQGARRSSEATSSTAAAIEEMTVSISHVSGSAGESAEQSQRASTVAVDGENMAVEAAGEIKRISSDITEAASLIHSLVERSQEIGGIAAVINDIANQTNLLALNAAIEAARAGEQGRGFAVVADEVRKLAERTASATQDITRTIQAVQNDTNLAVGKINDVSAQVNTGVSLTERAAEALREIRSHAADTLGKIREVASATHEQSQASNAIATNVEQIARMVEESDMSVSAAHGAVQKLDTLAQDLRATAARFKM
ncbi:methyl-accepting chemotaxis protein [Andreprevotia chitinilytica]|uniref:methyl-accepting chemotaxis protein n=1 Tax=Andreprevotia chitinilytica TaxID=396808 RepID=UPI00055958B3|nr:methyl-accepting chemotaxis protein [Andreprevotia chitinilytica]